LDTDTSCIDSENIDQRENIIHDQVGGMTDYYDLAELADRLFAISEEDTSELVELLDALDAEVRDELLTSDLLNAYQIFYYYFREVPTDLGEERLILQPGTQTSAGVLVEDHDLLELIFVVKEGTPYIMVSDGEALIATFRGPTAYREAVEYAEAFH
jgi:hypothetical protein